MRLQTEETSEDIVDRAAQAMRGLVVPPGPSGEVVERTRLASRRSPWLGGASHSVMRWAAVVMVASAGAVTWLALRGPNPTPVAHAPVEPPAEVDDALPAPPRIVGRVQIEGVPPELIAKLSPPPTLSSAGQNCQHHHAPPKDLSLVVASTGGLANVIVAVSAGLPDDTEYPLPAQPAVIDQKDCTYFPRMIPMQVGQRLVAKNSDPFLHTVRTNPLANVPEYIAQYTVDSVGWKLRPVTAAETFKVTCDLHPWMIAWVAAFDHPFYGVTKEDGSFDMPYLPPGTYTLKAWHERLGSVEQQVVVTYDGKLPPVQFKYGPDRVAAALSDRDVALVSAHRSIKPCCVGK